MTDLPSDDPIFDDADDLLGRAAFAERIATIILDAAVGSSWRIGVYGSWGEGKTSVLRLSQHRLRDAGAVCVWITPWAVSSAEELNARLVRELARELGIDLKVLKGATGVSEIFRKARAAGASFDTKVKMLDAVFGSVVQRLVDIVPAKFQSRLIPAIVKQQGSRRVVVFVDDLDRLRPDLVPDFLLMLREALSLPNFHYVLALSPEVVEQGLRQVHSGWGEPQAFLEKVVELPLYLPALSAREIRLFAEKHIATAPAAIHIDALETIIGDLPSNPRRLKLFLRYLCVLRGLLERFAKNEIDHAAFYVCQLLRLEFPEQSRALFRDEGAVKALEVSWGTEVLGLAKNAKETDLPEHSYAQKTADPERFMRLCALLRRREMVLGEYDLGRLFWLVEEPPTLTWKEVFALFKDCRSLSEIDIAQRLREFIAERQAAGPPVADALFRKAVGLRERIIDAAVEEVMEDATRAALDEAGDASKLIRALIGPLGVVRDGLVDAASWMDLLAHVKRWSNWVTPDYYGPAREEERELLKLASESMPIVLQIEVLQAIERNDSLSSLEGKVEHTLADQLAELRRALERTVCDSVLNRFRRAEGIAGLGSSEEYGIEREYAFNPNSSFHASAEHQANLAAIATTARDDEDVQFNFLRYLQMLQQGGFEGRGAARIDDSRALLGKSELLRLVWQAATARPLNARVMGTLVAARDRIISELKVAADVAPLPAWWLPMKGIPAPGGTAPPSA